jgi:hypothetical protein
VQLWSDLAAKLATSRSFPEGLEAYRDCISHRLQMATQDGQRLLDDGQKVIGSVTNSRSERKPAKRK